MKTSFHGPRSKANARLLIEAAKALGYPTSVVKTGPGGYMAPEDVVQEALGVLQIQEGVQYPAPDQDPMITQAVEIMSKPIALIRPNNGAARHEWAAYAKSVGIEVTDDDTRNGLVKKVDALSKGTD